MRVRDFYKANRRSGIDPRPLHLKIRVILTRPMTQEQARALMERAIETGIVPPGIKLKWMDWAKGSSGEASTGTLDPVTRKALRDFYGAMTKGETRFARVSQ